MILIRYTWNRFELLMKLICLRIRIELIDDAFNKLISVHIDHIEYQESGSIEIENSLHVHLVKRYIINRCIKQIICPEGKLQTNC